MAVNTVKSTLISNYESKPVTFSPSGQLGGIQKVAMGAVALGTGDLEAGDIVLLAPVASNARLISINIQSDNLGASMTADFGIYDALGVVVDADAYVTAASIDAVNTNLALNAAALNAYGQMLWERAAATTDPGVMYYLALTIVTPSTAVAGDVAFAISYTI